MYNFSFFFFFNFEIKAEVKVESMSPTRKASVNEREFPGSQ